MKTIPLLLLILTTALLNACAVNPVTGQRELALVPESSELQIGAQQYAPARQMQGGDYRANPRLTEYVQAVGKKLAAVSDRKLPYEFQIVNDSSPNAWALPGGKIAVNRGLLLELDNEAELAAVLGHEIVHAAARHTAQGMERGLLLRGALSAVGVVTGSSGYSDLAVGAAGVGANLINQSYSREAELEADHFGMNYMRQAGYDPQAAVGLQETFVRLSKNREQNWLTGLFASHPPSQERVEKNRQYAATLPRGGTLGRQIYHRQIDDLKRSKPAYEAYEEGVKLVDKEPAKALKLADKAISIEPKEGLFYGLRGDAYYQMNDMKNARAAYDQAVEYNSEFFRPYLHRGVVRSRLGDESGARSDLQKSLQLLPTANAHYYLGRIAASEGDQKSAASHYKMAASSNSPVGRAAARELASLEPLATPDRFLNTSLALDRLGNLLVKVTNNGKVAVRDAAVLVGRRDAVGNIYRGNELRLEGVLEAGKSITLKSAISGLKSRDQLQEYDARVLRAAPIN